MRKIDIVLFTIKNIVNSRIKGVLCVISVCVGISSVCLVMEIGSNAESQIQGELSQISSNVLTLSSKEKINHTELEILENNPEIKSAMPYVFEFGTYYMKNTDNPSVICGVNEKISDIFNIEVIHGRLPTKSEVNAGKNVMLVDDLLAKKLYQRTNIVGKSLKVSLGGQLKKYTIIGVISSQKASIESMLGANLPDLLYVPYTTINEAYGENKVESVAISCFSTNTKRVSDEIVRDLTLSNRGRVYQIENINQFTDTVMRITAILSLLVSAIAGISVLVGGIGIMNALVASTESRKNEIGVYIALGAKPREITLCFILEAVIISVIGGLAGTLISSGILYLANYYAPFALQISPINILLSFLGAAVCGGLFGYLPAKKAGTLNPIDAIRWE